MPVSKLCQQKQNTEADEDDILLQNFRNKDEMEEKKRKTLKN